MRSPSPRAALLIGGALAVIPAFAPLSAHAEEVAAAEQPVRDYLPGDIVVTGTRDGYASDDGSSATKTPTPLIDVPQAVAMITEDQLDDQAITQLNDALRYVPGVSLGTGEGHRDQIVLRGQPSTADFYLDGIRDDAQYYRATYATDRIEVLKGANALIFGRGGGGGAINRVSKTARFSGLAAEFDAHADTWGAFALAGDVNLTASDALAGRINATYEEFASHRDAYEGRFFGIAPTLSAKLGADTRLTASYTHEDDARVVDRGIPSFADRPIEGYDRTFFGDPAFNRSTNRLDTARLRIDHDFGGGLTVNATGHFAEYDKYYGNVVPASATATTVTVSGYESANQRRNWIGQANLIWQADFGAIGSTLLAGVEYGDQRSAAQRYNTVFDGPTTIALAEVLAIPRPSRGAISNSSTSQLHSFSAYLQEQLDFGIVQLVGGLRYEEFDLATVNIVTSIAATRKDSKVSPRAGIVLKPMEALSLYAAYSTSFLPQSGDQFGVLDTTTAALAPEKFENLEAGAKWAIRPDLFATAAVFRLDRDNSRWSNPLTGLTELTGANRTEGFELSLTGKVTPAWQVNYGYTYLDGEVRSATGSTPAGRRLQQLPRHQIALWNRYDLSDSLGFGLGAIHQSQQFAALSNATTLPAYWRVDAAAYWTLSDRIGVQLNVENLFDEGYYASAHGDNNIQPGKPLTAKLGIKLSY